jgi:hypothetical protein
MADSYNEKAKTIAVKANMRTVQNAAEKYSTDHTFMYPTQIDDDFKCYFPEGDPAAKKAGKAPLNPFTGTAEWPVLGSVKDLSAARAEMPVELGKGVIEYSPLDGGKSYAIRGGAENGKAVVGDSATAGSTVLSRDDFEKPSVTQ